MERQKLERQIKALEYKLAELKASNKPNKNIFALENKIKKLRTELQKDAWNQYLAK